MKNYAKGFYKSKSWHKVSTLYMSNKNYMCERCGGVATICHHKKYITPWNIDNPDITLNMDNLESLCQECHNQEHSAKVSRAIFDESGNMVGAQDSREVMEYKKAVEAIERMKNDRIESPYSHFKRPSNKKVP